jgi:hypothetical protein
MYRATVNLDLIHFGINLGAELHHHLAVDAHSPLNDELLHLSAGTDSTLS